MDKPISIGDLVQVVRGHACLMESRGGAIFVVKKMVRKINGGWTCPKCGERDIATNDSHGASGIGPAPVKIDKPYQHLTIGPGSIPLSFLKRIPPLEETEGEKRRTEIPA